MAPLTLIDNVLDLFTELVGEEPDDGEDDEAREDTGGDVTHRNYHRVPTVKHHMVLVETLLTETTTESL